MYAEIFRWDRSTIDQLPDYIKVHFCTLLDAVEKFEEELAREGKSYRISYLKEAVRSKTLLLYLITKLFNINIAQLLKIVELIGM